MRSFENSPKNSNSSNGEEFSFQKNVSSFDSLKDVPFMGDTPTRDGGNSLRSRLPNRGLPDNIDRNQEASPYRRTSFYKEVFNQKEIGDIAKTCRPFLNEIEFNKPRAWDILEAYEHNYRKGNAVFVDYLSELFGIEPPEIVYRRARERGLAGAYYPDENKIYFYYRTNRDERGRGDDMNTIAHEMWHALQESVSIRKDSQRGELYRYNSNFYINYLDDDEGYHDQLMEKEAFYFGDSAERKLKAMFLQGQDAKTRIARGKDVVTKFINTTGRRNG